MAKQALHDIFCDVLGVSFSDGENHCYFEPPSNITLKYPCIIYHYTNDDETFADNTSYMSFKRYTVTVIDYDPDSKIAEELKKLPYCSSDRNFSKDGLSHFIYTLYYSGPRI